MIEGFVKEDIDDLRKVLDKVIQKAGKIAKMLETIKNDSVDLEKIIDDGVSQPGQTEADEWQKLIYKFNRVKVVAVVSLIERILYVESHDNKEMEDSLFQLRRLLDKQK